MLKHLNNYKKLYIVMVVILIGFLGYFFLPLTFNVSNEDQVYIQIDKEIEGINYYYILNEQEVNDLVNILEKSKFYRGVSMPETRFSDKSIHVIIQGDLSPIITIYNDTDKTYTFANISTGIFLNIDYRISNKVEVRKFVENIVNTKTAEFLKIPTK